MQQDGLKGQRKYRRISTTDSKHSYPVAPNLLDQKFQAQKPNQKWVADITYISTKEGWLYVAGVLDLFSRRIVGLGYVWSDGYAPGRECFTNGFVPKATK